MDEETGMREIDFKVWMPVELLKGGSKDQYRIGGVAATEDLDLEGEKILMKGMDISYLQSGRAVFNWNHGKEPGDVIGEIDKAEKDSKKLYVEGFLYKGVKKAVETFSLMKAMDEQSNRRMGFSVEGKIRQRENGKITKSWVKAVAVTHEPVNTTTVAELIKAMSKYGMCCDGGTCSCDIPSEDEYLDVAKALAAGHEIAPTAGGGVLRVQSLEADVKKKKRKKVYKSLEEAVDGVLALRPNLSREFAKRLVATIMKRKEAA